LAYDTLGVVESVFVTAATRKSPAQPLGVIAALASGFETVNARLELILLPLILDLFLWFGPHLSVQSVAERSFQATLQLLKATPGADSAMLQNFQTMRDMLMPVVEQFNLFSMLSTAPFGLPSLLSERGATTAPMGAPLVWMVDNILEYVLLWGAFVLIGLFMGALYFGGIAQQVRETRLDLRRLFGVVWGDWARLTTLAIILVLSILIVWTPFQIMAALVSLASQLVGSIVSLIGTTLVLWILLYTVFAVHGIVLQRRGLFGALLDSLRLVQRNLSATAMLYIIIILLNLGLSQLWNIPADESWFLLIGVVGHALVATALVTATFVYYQDRYRHWLELRQTQQARASTGPNSANRNAS
jgi:hypothetical protein